MSTKLKLFSLLFSLCFYNNLFAQDSDLPKESIQDVINEPEIQPVCGTLPMTASERRNTLERLSSVDLRNAGVTALPIRMHIVTENDGSGGISQADINVALSYLNYHFLDAGIEFYICTINTINSSTYYTFDQDDEVAMFAAHSTYDAVNVYFVNSITTSSGGSACGYARYPSNNSITSNVLMRNSCTTGASTGTMVHEFGHFFDLQHTHDGTEDGNLDTDAENVARTGANANCSTKGDMCCDTPADPKGSEDSACNFVNSGTSTEDVHGVTYAADVTNTMSYYSDVCGENGFSDDQLLRVVAALPERIGHTNYDVDGCVVSVVTDPSGLAVALNNSYGVDITWTDNATNETGYLIERSEDGGTSWRVVEGGGVGPNETVFTDNTLESNTSYSYRVKASNDGVDDYSATASITSGLIHCVPSHQSNSCTLHSSGTFGVAIYNFEFMSGATALIENFNNGCSGALSVFSVTHSANVTAGDDYDVDINLQVSPGSSYYAQWVTIWMDKNQDGDFEDTDEMLYQSAGSAGPNISIPITIPATALNGNTTLRVRTASNGTGQVSDPCVYMSLGESEDYNLFVSGGLPVELVSFSGRKEKEEIKLNWSTASEENNDYFMIEKSSNGIDFEYMDQLRGSGTSTEFQQYIMMDRDPQVGMNYYRMIQVDLDGTKHVQDKIVSVEYLKAGEVVISPNPIRDGKLRFNFNAIEKGDLSVAIFDFRGDLKRETSMELGKGSNHFEIEMSDLAKGIYLLRVIQRGEVQTIRFVKE